MWQGSSCRSDPGAMDGNKSFVEKLVPLVVDLCLKVGEDRWEVGKHTPALCKITTLSASSVVTSEEVDEVVVNFSLRCIPMDRHFDPSEGDLRDSARVFIDGHVLANVLRKRLAQIDRIRSWSSHGQGRQERPSLYGDSAER